VVCRCGNVGCLEALAGGAALARDATAAARAGRSPMLARRLAQAPLHVTVLLPLVEGQSGGFTRWWWSVLLAIVLFVLFARWEGRMARLGKPPVLDPQLAHTPRLSRERGRGRRVAGRRCRTRPVGGIPRSRSAASVTSPGSPSGRDGISLLAWGLTTGWRSRHCWGPDPQRARLTTDLRGGRGAPSAVWAACSSPTPLGYRDRVGRHRDVPGRPDR
jgi:hypothetical protein